MAKSNSKDRIETTFRTVRFLLISALGGILFAWICEWGSQPEMWKGTPIMGYFAGTVWLYVFGIAAGLTANAFGLFLFALQQGHFLSCMGWFVGNVILCVDAGIILLMFKAFMPSIEDEKLHMKILYVLVFAIGIVLTAFYGIALFKPLTDWIFSSMSILKCFKIGIIDSIGFLVSLCAALPIAACIHKAISFFAPNLLSRLEFDALENLK